MKTLNRITILGNIGADPETKTFDNGTTLTAFSVATSSYMGKDANGEAKHATQWHRCSAFGKTGELIAQFCLKGDKIYIEGEMRYRDYTNKEGVKVYLSEIQVSDFTFMSNKAEAPKQNADGSTDDLPY